MTTRTKTRSNRKIVAAIANAPIIDAPVVQTVPPVEVTPDAPVDYANMATDALLSAYWAFIGDVRSDGIISLINATGGTSASLVTGELAALYSVGIGLRKAHGRGIKASVVVADLPGVTIPEGFNPTFALYLAGGKLRPDDANERKVASEVKSAIRSKIRAARKA